MEVTINGQAADLILEHEKNLGEVLSALELWLEETGFSISEIVANGELIAAQDIDGIYDRVISNIHTLDIQAASWVELLQEALASTYRFIGDQNPSTESEWFDGAGARFIQHKDPSLYQSITQYIQSEGIPHDDLRSLIKERLEELDNPVKSLVDMSAGMEEVVHMLEELPLDLQMGKDTQAAKSIEVFSAMIEKLLRLIPILAMKGQNLKDREIEGMSFTVFMNELASALKELLAAYESQDAVLIGDLSEYELAPRLRSLHHVIPSLVEEG